MLMLEQPLALILLILFIGFVLSLSVSAAAHGALRVITLVTSLCALLVGVLSCLAFNKSDFGFQFITKLHFIPEYNLALTLGADGLSMIFLLLTLFIFPILFLSAWNVTKQPKQFLNHLLGIEILLVLTFSVLDIFYFYVFFESLLIPMFILIGVWGARERKIKAAYYFFLYTLFGSLFMLFGMIYLYFITGSTNFFVLLNTQLDAEQQQLIWLCFFLAFAVKMPLFPLHIWLPEAHVEAPTVGSMLLASLLLKLGGYGFLRFSLTFLAEGSHQYAPLVCTCSLLGVLYGSLSTLRQIDLKRIIAYSSVAHMNLVMLGLFSFNQQGLEGATYLMVGHGVVSAALFFCVGVLYDRHHSRLLRYYGGLVAVMPLFATFFLAFTLANMGFPGTSNFLGETLVFLGIFALSSTVMLFASPGIVLSAAYSTWLYNRVTFGTLKTIYIKEFTDLNRRETAVFVTLLVFMLILGISANFVLDFVHVALKGIIINAEVSSLKISFSYEAPLLLLAPDTPQVTAYAPLSYRFTSLLCCNIFVIRTVAAITAKSKVKSPKNSIPKKESHSLLPAAVPHNTKPKARNNSQPVRRKPTSPLSPVLSGFFFIRLVSRNLPPTGRVTPGTPQDAPLSETAYTALIGAYLVFYALSLMALTMDWNMTKEEVDTAASAALVCFSRFRSCFDRCSFHQVATSVAARQLSTVPSRDASAASSVSSEEASVTPSGSNSRNALDVAVPPLASYKHLLMKRFKHPLLYDSEAKGILGWFRNLRRPRPTAPYPWEDTGRVAAIEDVFIWITDVTLARLGTKIYFIPTAGSPIVCGTVIKLEAHLRLVQVPLGHTVHSQDIVTMSRPHWYRETSEIGVER